MISKPKLNQPDVEITTTFNGIDVPESLNVNITIPSNMLKDFINQQSIVDFKRNHIELNIREYGNIKIAQDVITYNDKVYTAIKPQPTFSECIKKWEEKGFIVNNTNALYIFLHHEQHGISMFINKKETKYHTFYGYISLELSELLTQTLKALEEIKND